MSNLEKPPLGPVGYEAIKVEQYQIHKAYTQQLQGMHGIEAPYIPRPGDPPPPTEPMRLCRILSSYAFALFDVEAKRYPHEPELPRWLTNLASRIEEMVMQRVNEIDAAQSSSLEKLTYHAARDVLRRVIRDSLQDHAKMRMKIRLPNPQVTASKIAEPKEVQIPVEVTSKTLEKATKPVATETTGVQINRWREECGLSIEELAHQVGLNPRSVQRHLADDHLPRGTHPSAYNRVFSKLLKTQIVITKTP